MSENLSRRGVRNREKREGGCGSTVAERKFFFFWKEREAAAQWARACLNWRVAALCLHLNRAKCRTRKDYQEKALYLPHQMMVSSNRWNFTRYKVSVRYLSWLTWIPLYLQLVKTLSPNATVFTLVSSRIRHEFLLPVYPRQTVNRHFRHLCHRSCQTKKRHNSLPLICQGNNG